MIKNFSYVFQNKTLTKTMYKYNYNYSKRTNKSQKIKQLSKNYNRPYMSTPLALRKQSATEKHRGCISDETNGKI